jgi:hypothetical protein
VWSDCLTDEQWYAGFGWDEAEIEPVVNAIAVYILAYNNYAEDNSTVKRILRVDARKAAEALMRRFYRAFVANNPKIPTEKKIMLGWPHPSGHHGQSPVPENFVTFRIEAGGVGQVILYFKPEGAENDARPPNYDGAVVKWLIADHPASTVEELITDDDIAKRTPHTLTFSQADRAKTISVSMCWQNASGKGPWAAVQWAIIP